MTNTCFAAPTRGFSLIELMIVVAIVAILTAVALPAYRAYMTRSADRACLQEAKAYANAVFVVLNENDGTNNQPIPTPSLQACFSITQAVDFNTNLQAIPRNPGRATIACNMSTAVCSF